MRNNKKRLFKLFGLAVFAICFLTCEKEGELPVKDTLEFDEKTFYSEWAAWEELGIKDYSVEVKCEQHSPQTTYFSYQVIVKDSKTFKIESSHGEDYGTFGKNTISELFLWTKYLSLNNKNVHGSIKITYNNDFHYPEVIDIDLPPKTYSPNPLGSGAVYLSEFLPLPSVTEK